jgi:hypothetical protein
MPHSTDLQALTLSGIVHRCTNETELFFQRRTYDPRYCFVIPALPTGEYELILAGTELEIHVQHIQVGDVQERREDVER